MDRARRVRVNGARVLMRVPPCLPKSLPYTRKSRLHSQAPPCVNNAFSCHLAQSSDLQESTALGDIGPSWPWSTAPAGLRPPLRFRPAPAAPCPPTIFYMAAKTDEPQVFHTGDRWPEAPPWPVATQWNGGLQQEGKVANYRAHCVTLGEFAALRSTRRTWQGHRELRNL